MQMLKKAIVLSGALLMASAAHAAPKTLYAFTGGADGSFPEAPMIETGGVLYGTTSSGYGDSYGALFVFDISKATLTASYPMPAGTSFARSPNASLPQFGKTLYGIEEGSFSTPNGSIYSFDPTSGILSTVYAFGQLPDGNYPQSDLVAVNGKLYGTTPNGGSETSQNCSDDGCGTIYQFDPTQNVETVLYRFQGGTDGGYPGQLIAYNGDLLGSAYNFGDPNCQCAMLFRFSPANNTLTTLYAFQGGSDGAGGGEPILQGDFLYGASYDAGNQGCEGGNGCGILYAFNLKTLKKTTLYTFPGGGGGGEPINGLIYYKGKLYGVTRTGGTPYCNRPNGCGVIYQFDIAARKAKVLYAFRGNHLLYGSALATLTLVGDTIYGTTADSHGGYNGTIFSFKP